MPRNTMKCCNGYVNYIAVNALRLNFELYWYQFKLKATDNIYKFQGLLNSTDFMDGRNSLNDCCSVYINDSQFAL